VLLFEPLQHPDVCETERAPTLHGYANLQTLLWRGLRSVRLFRWCLCDGENGEYEEHEEKESATHRGLRGANDSKLGS
jgi:hypothetical protein